MGYKQIGSPKTFLKPFFIVVELTDSSWASSSRRWVVYAPIRIPGIILIRSSSKASPPFPFSSDGNPLAIIRDSISTLALGGNALDPSWIVTMQHLQEKNRPWPVAHHAANEARFRIRCQPWSCPQCTAILSGRRSADNIFLGPPKMVLLGLPPRKVMLPCSPIWQEKEVPWAKLSCRCSVQEVRAVCYVR